MILYIDGLKIETAKISTIAQLSIIAISIGFTGISLTATHVPNIIPEKRNELICVSQKFILVGVLFIFLLPPFI